MNYDVSHRTTFSYEWNVSISQHLLHLAPREKPGQSVSHHGFIIEPAPSVSQVGIDYFGNNTTYLTVEEPHDRLTIISSFYASLDPIPNPVPSDTLPWNEVAALATRQTDPDALEALDYIFPSPFVNSLDAGSYAAPSFQPGRPILEAAIDLTNRIHADFKYEGGVTDIYTPVDKVISERRGVCQDFAHLEIACFRAMGLPARYVSGYLRTHPPEGQEKRTGADASHAWLAVWVPNFGWIDLDPTNDLVVADEHITVAWGRDYGDVSPINGIVLGGGAQEIDVAVDVRPIEE